MVAATMSPDPERPEHGEQRQFFLDLDLAVLAAMPDQDDAVRAHWARLRG